MNTILTENEYTNLYCEIYCTWAEADTDLRCEGSYLDEPLMDDIARWVTKQMHPELDDCQRDYLVTKILNDHDNA